MCRGKNHTMIVAKYDEKVVGFIELGVIPLPLNRVPIHHPPMSEEDSSVEGKDVEDIWNQEERGDGNMGKKRLIYAPTVGNLLTLPSYRRRGIASSLMSQAEEVARGWGYDSMVCAVDVENSIARKLYLRTGFEDRFTAMTFVQSNLQRKQRLFYIMVKTLNGLKNT